jgi:hypothetical protein
MSEYINRSDQLFPTATWRTSSFCGPNGGNCVAINLGRVGIAGIRDTKPTSSPVLAFTSERWNTFVYLTREGRYNP